MSTDHSTSAVRRGGRVVVGAVVLAPTLLLLQYGAPPAVAADPAASASSAPAGCGLQLLARQDGGADSDLTVALPDRLSGADLPASAFALRQADQPVPLSVQRRPAAERAVAVVLASTASTAPAEHDAAQAAALTILAGLPAGVRTTVGSTGAGTALVPLSLDRAAATRAVQRSQPAGGSSAAVAVDRVARDLPAGADVVLLTDGDQEAATPRVRALAARLQQRNTVVTRIGYAGPSSADAAGAWATSPSRRGCAAATAGASLPRQLAQARTLLLSQYRLRAPLTAAAPVTLSVQAAGEASSLQVPAVGSASAVADPYRDTGPSRTSILLLLALAAELALLGFALVVKPGRGRQLVRAAPRRAALQKLPFRPGEGALDRTGPGARPSRRAGQPAS